MIFEHALNIIWFLLGVVALAMTLRVRARRSEANDRAPAWLHICGVALIIAALFPYISATDDVLRIQHLNIEHRHDQTEKKTANDQLIRLYETMDTPLVCTVQQISLVFFFVSLLFLPTTRILRRSVPLASGRSPPLNVFA